MPIPAPQGRQKDVLYLPGQGHFVVLGTAGSGKTTLAVLRASHLADPATSHAGKTLLVTFNRALVAYLHHLAENTLGHVVVENYHKFARGYLHDRGLLGLGQICGDPAQRAQLIEAAVNEIGRSRDLHGLLDSPMEQIVDEVAWLDHHGIAAAEEYLDAERIGRASARISRSQRDAVFEIRRRYRELRTARGWKYDWEDLASAVSTELEQDEEPRRYRHVVIDEGQDFTPEMLRSLSKAIPPDGSLTFFGDTAQQIYGRRLSWRDAGLSVPSVWRFEENYRNTRQIASLGLAIASMPYYRDVPDMVAPKSPLVDGPPPSLVACADLADEVRTVVEQAQALGRTQSVAILVRKRKLEGLLPLGLRRASTRLDGDLDVWRPDPGIYYGVYHSAKGLEFDAVILPFLSDEAMPDPDERALNGPEEAAAYDGRLLYVGITRARTRLIMTYHDRPTSLLPAADGLYELV